MCGIVGVAGDMWGKHEKAFRTLLILDSLRGEDSTGVCAVGKADGVARVAKHLGDPFQLFDSKQFDRAVNRINRVLIGHNRYATSGAVNARNAHPFENEWLVGVHNGTLTNKWKLADAADFQVDSENLYHHIMKHGLRNAIDIVEGAYALVWWDKAEETLNILRNGERPLYFCTTDDAKCIFWASEAWMLITALQRHDIKYNEIQMVEKDLHFSVHVDDKGRLFKPLMVPMAQPPKPVVVQNNVYRGNTNTTYTPPATTPAKPTGTVINITQNQSATTPPAAKEEPKEKKPEGGSNSPKALPYTNAKGVRLEMLHRNRDEHGSEYVACFDVRNPHASIRWYFKKNDAIANFIGEDIICDISTYVPSPRGDYWKVSAWTVQLAIPDESAGACELPAYYLGHNGKAFSHEEWCKNYSSCGWCSNPIDPEHGEHKFTTQGECFCGDCAKNHQVTEYVKFN